MHSRSRSRATPMSSCTYRAPASTPWTPSSSRFARVEASAASGTDMPEASGITAAPSTAYRIQGTSAAVDPPDDYEDRDTFAFTTSATTTQMSIRLNWAATTVDFDYRVYPSTTGTPLSIGA